MSSPTKTALAKGILDAAVLELRSAVNEKGGYVLAEDALQALEHRCATLCAEHLSLDRSTLHIIRAGVSPSKKHPLNKGKHPYAVAFSITSDNRLFRFTLYKGAMGDGFNALEPKFEKMTEDRIAFSVFFQVSTIDGLKEDPTPRIITRPDKEECHGTRAL